MTRPLKPGIGGYILDVDFLDNRKVRRIKKGFCCPQAIECLIYLLGNIYKKNGYYMRWNKDMSFDMADSVGVSHGAAQELVKKAVQVEFFDRNVFERLEILTSTEIMNRYFTATERRKSVLIRRDIYDLLSEKPDLPENVRIISHESTQREILWDDTVNPPAERGYGRAGGTINPEENRREFNKNTAAAAPACVHVREPEKPPPEILHESQVLSVPALPAYAKTVILPDCIERFRAYCEAWNGVVGKPRIPPDIPHYAEMFAMTEHRCQDTTLFSRVIEHLRAHPQSVVRTGKISLKATTIFSVDFVTNVLASAYDIDFSEKKRTLEKRRGKHGGRYRPNPAEYTGEF